MTLSLGTASFVPALAAEPSAAAAAFSGKLVTEIRIEGLKRIEQDAVIAKLVTKLGQAIDSDQVRSDIQAIFAMGFFDDIEAKGQDLGGGKAALVYVVRERPVISKLSFEGNERVGTNDLQEVIKVKEWSILDVNRVKEDIALIQKNYEDKGFYLAKVNFEVRPIEKKPDEVELVYKINDYDKVQIKKITFLNNKAFSDEQLKAIFGETREGGALSFLSSAGNFKESAFKNDLQRLTYWYLDHGYVKFRFENPIVTISDDKRWLFVSIYVDEGEQYSISSYDFSGDLLFPKTELHRELIMKEGETFAITKRNADIQKLTEKYQDLGYAFVNVIPKMDFDDPAKKIRVDYSFEKGNLVYFNEINILGNTKTHDKVIRRELRIKEGELYSGSKLRQSRENVERLGYFAPGEVVFNTVSPSGRNDLLDVEITIKERSTGTITLGAGYGTAQGLFLTSQVAEINLFGRGQTLNFSLQWSGGEQADRNFNLGFTDPYAFDSRWSAGFDLYYLSYRLPDLFKVRRAGGDIRMGYPLMDYTTAFVTYKLEDMGISEEFNPAGNNQDFVDSDQDAGLLSSVTLSTVRDKRNNRFEPSAGNYQSASLEFAGLGGDKRFLKWIVNNRIYWSIAGDLVLRNSTEYGQITAVGGKELPSTEKFFLGGPNNMKGFSAYTLTPRGEEIPYTQEIDGETITRVYRQPLGGAVEMFSLFELEHPLIKEAGLKGLLFFDVGNVYEKFPALNDFTIRADAGFGIRWFSPIGPLRFEWGYPIKARPGEDSPVFSFFIGPPF